jgi:hypothetical protein
MSQEQNQQPSILSKVSAKTRGILVQQQKTKEEREKQEKSDNMSTEQT